MVNSMDKLYRSMDPVERADEDRRRQEDMEAADRKDHERRENITLLKPTGHGRTHIKKLTEKFRRENEE